MLLNSCVLSEITNSLCCCAQYILQNHFRFIFSRSFFEFSGLSTVYRAVTWISLRFACALFSKSFLMNAHRSNGFTGFHSLEIFNSVAHVECRCDAYVCVVTISFILHQKINYTSFAGFFFYVCRYFAKSISILGLCVLHRFGGFEMNNVLFSINPSIPCTIVGATKGSECRFYFHFIFIYADQEMESCMKIWW